MAQATVRMLAARPTAVIIQTTTWEALPALWPVLLGEVWRAVRSRAPRTKDQVVEVFSLVEPVQGTAPPG